MRIDSLTVGPFAENTWLVVDEATSRAVLIDPGDEPDAILAMLDRSGATLDAIWLTHAHLDHIGAVEGVRRRHHVPVYLHPLDRELYERAAEQAEAYGVEFEQPAPADRELADGQALSLGTLSFDVVHLPGHAPGHVAFIGHGVMMGGDVLFAGSIGRTDLPYADPAAMQRTLDRVAALDPSLIVHPGHGPSTTIGEERASNVFLNGGARIVTR